METNETRPARTEGDAQPVLTALAFTRPLLPIAPADRRRTWMQEARDRWPNRCLPLLIANESGWTLENPHTFTAVWSGDEKPDAVTVEFEGESPAAPIARSHFGFGVLTFTIPYVFRTPRGWNCLHAGLPITRRMGSRRSRGSSSPTGRSRTSR